MASSKTMRDKALNDYRDSKKKADERRESYLAKVDKQVATMNDNVNEKGAAKLAAEVSLLNMGQSLINDQEKSAERFFNAVLKVDVQEDNKQHSAAALEILSRIKPTDKFVVDSKRDTGLDDDDKLKAAMSEAVTSGEVGEITGDEISSVAAAAVEIDTAGYPEEEKDEDFED